MSIRDHGPTPERRTAPAGVRGLPPRDRATPAIAVAAGIAMIAVGALVPTSWWVGFFAHPLRLERLGAMPQTTRDGAAAWRAALVVGGVVAPALVALVAFLCGRTAGAWTVDAPVGPSRRGDGSRLLRLDALAMIALLVLATIVRAPRLLESLWYDEIAALLDFSQFGPGPTMGNYFTPSNHILQGMSSWVSMVLAGGADELSLRVPSLLASLATIPAMFALGREATRVASGPIETPPGRLQHDLPWLLAWIAALSPIAVLEGVEARGYAFMILTAAVATTLLLRGLRRPTTTTWTVYAVVIALGAWSHLVTICVALGHGAVVAWLLTRRAERRAAVAAVTALALSALLTIVLYSPALPDILSIRGEFKALDGDEPTLVGPEGLHALLSFGGAWFWWSALPAAICAAMGVGVCARRAPLRRAALAALAGLPVAVALAWFGDSWLYARFLLFALPGAALLIGTGLAAMLARSRIAGIVAVIVVGAGWLGDLAVRPPKQPLRDAVDEVAAARGVHPTARDAVATIGLADNVLAWYGVLRGIDIASTGSLGRNLEAVLDRDRPRFVILLYPRSVPPDRFDLLEHRGYSLRTRHRGWVDWTNGDVLVFERGQGGG